MRLEKAIVESNRALSTGCMLMAMRCSRIARSVRPGQFVHILVPDLESAVLRRPFSVFSARGHRIWIMYKLVGTGTRAMAKLDAGIEISLIGPLGNGFPMPRLSAYPVLVAGGYGVAPLVFLRTRCRRPGVFFLGAKTAEELQVAKYIRKSGWELVLATEDGTTGFRGKITDALQMWLKDRADDPRLEFFGCGPQGMLRAMAEQTSVRGWKTWVSLDRHMGCGVGACLACVQKMRARDGSEILVRVCRDGPVFEAKDVVWDL